MTGFGLQNNQHANQCINSPYKMLTKSRLFQSSKIITTILVAFKILRIFVDEDST